MRVLDTLDALEQRGDARRSSSRCPMGREIYTAGTPSGTSNDYAADELPLYQGETTASLQDYLTAS